MTKPEMCHFHFKMTKRRWKFNNLKVNLCAYSFFFFAYSFLKMYAGFYDYTNFCLASFSLIGHAAEAQWQVIKQGVEEEVCHPV